MIMITIDNLCLYQNMMYTMLATQISVIVSFWRAPALYTVLFNSTQLVSQKNAAELDSQIQIEYDRIIPGFFRKDISYKLNKLNFMKINGSQQV